MTSDSRTVNQPEMWFGVGLRSNKLCKVIKAIQQLTNQPASIF